MGNTIDVHMSALDASKVQAALTSMESAITSAGEALNQAVGSVGGQLSTEFQSGFDAVDKQMFDKAKESTSELMNSVKHLHSSYETGYTAFLNAIRNSKGQ